MSIEAERLRVKAMLADPHHPCYAELHLCHQGGGILSRGGSIQTDICWGWAAISLKKVLMPSQSFTVFLWWPPVSIVLYYIVLYCVTIYCVISGWCLLLVLRTVAEHNWPFRMIKNFQLKSQGQLCRWFFIL